MKPILYLVRIACFVVRNDVSHERTLFDILIITHYMDSILARLGGPILDVTRSVVLIVTLDPGLRRALDGKACMKGTKG